ncbi:MAG: flagellin [Bryobacteraceae bacterium]|nr:flagellin [Bryobacteraceae bacterium]
MAFNINTNLPSLQAQENLRLSSDMQAKTINRVTSGLRIVSSGDDAAGLAIANGYRSDVSVLTQGVRNANDGLSQLQIVDGGMNNISKLLDRARTLATQSASGTFTGERSVLNSEFQSVLQEIDRQAQAVGLNTGGIFAKNLQVFIGGGKTSGGVTEISNGSVGIDLTTSTIDAQSLGLKGVQAMNGTAYNLSTGTTRVESIVADANNVASLATPGFTKFRLSGPGFGDSKSIELSVNVNGIASVDAMVQAVNAAIDAAGNQATSQATAFKNAGVQAKVVTDSSGNQMLAFSSSTASFQVAGGDKMANALLGNFKTGAEGADIASTTTGGVVGANAFTGATTIKYRVEGGGMTSPYEFTFSSVAETQAAYGARLQAAVAADSTLKAAGITVTDVDPTASGGIQFSSAKGEDLRITVTGDTANRLGFGGFMLDGSNNLEYNTVSLPAEGAAPAGNTRFTFSFNGGAGIDVDVAFGATNNGTDAEIAAAVNAAIATKAGLEGSDLQATVAAGAITFTAGAGTKFRLQVSASAAGADFGAPINGGTVGYTAPTVAGADYNAYVAAGSNQLANTAGTATPLTFSAINFAGDKQALTVQATDAVGTVHSKAIELNNTNARSLDEAINTVNKALQESNDSTLQKMTAVKVVDGGVEKFTLISTVKDFRLSVGKNANNVGLDATNGVVSAKQVGSGANSTIDTLEGAQSAVTALADAVKTLGKNQAVVGKGQNQFTYAVNLAQSQVSNIAAAESRIRDADLAAEAANLTKAQVAIQAGIAALAQANSAPQAVLSLLRG